MSYLRQLAFLVFFIATSASGQTLSPWYMLGPRHYTDVTLQSPSVFVASCTNGYIYTSRDSGRKWAPTMLNDTCQLLSIAFYDSLHGAAVDLQNQLFVTSDGSISWVQRTLPFYSSSKIVAPAPNILIVTDFFGQVHRTTDLGLSWKTTRIRAEDKPLVGVSFRTRNNAFLVSDSNIYAVTLDGGATWEIKTFTRPDGEIAYCTSVSFVNPKYGFVGLAGGCFLSQDSGKTWDFRKIPNVGPIRAGSLLNDTTLFAFGNTGDVIYSSDYGSTFEKRHISRTLGYGEMASSAIMSDHSGVAVGEDGTIYRADDVGVWERVSWVPLKGDFVMDYSTGTSGQSIWRSITPSSYFQVMTSSSDLGKSWSSVLTPFQKLEYPHFWSQDSGVLFHRYNLGQSYITTNGGAVWIDSLISEPVPPRTWWANFFKVSPSGFGLLLGSQWIYNTLDHGLHWNFHEFPVSKSTPFSDSRPYSSFFANGSIQGRGALAIYRTSDTLIGRPNKRNYHSEIYLTLDGGEHWAPVQNSPRTPRAWSVCLKSDSEWYVGCFDGVLWRTTNAGVSWDSTVLEAQNLTAIGFLNDSTGFIGSNRGEIFYTTNRGHSWRRHDIPFKDEGLGPVNVNGFDFPAGNLVLARTLRGLFRLYVQQPAAVVETSATNIFPYLIADVYPNPAQRQVNVRLQGVWSAPSERIQAEVFDVLGRKLLDLSEAAQKASNGSISTFEFDAGTLSAGVYTLRYTLAGTAVGKNFVINR